MKHIYLLLLFSSVILSFSAQEEDESCLPPSKKVLKFIEVGSKALDAKTAVDNFNSAIELAPENAMVYYEYAMYAYDAGLVYYEKQPNPAMGDRSFQKAEESESQSFGRVLQVSTFRFLQVLCRPSYTRFLPLDLPRQRLALGFL